MYSKKHQLLRSAVNHSKPTTVLLNQPPTTPQGQRAAQPRGTSTAVDGRQLYAPSAVRPASSLYQRRDAWYEFLLKQINPDDVDYGSWLEERRQAFLDSSVRNPYFWYSAGVAINSSAITISMLSRTGGWCCLWACGSGIGRLQTSGSPICSSNEGVEVNETAKRRSGQKQQPNKPAPS